MRMRTRSYLDENELVLESIHGNLNAQNLEACAAYQMRLQENLLYLASLVDMQAPGGQDSAQQPTQQPNQQDGEDDDVDVNLISLDQRDLDGHDD